MKFYIGDYTTEGSIGVALCSLENNVLSLISKADTFLKSPNYAILSKDKKILYVTTAEHSEGEETNSVAAFALEGDEMKLVSIRSTGGLSACHLCLSEDERFLYVANYSTGMLSVFPVNGAQIGKRIQLIEHHGSGPDYRQERAHLHYVCINDNDHLLYAVDLGIDAVVSYERDPETGLLKQHDRIDFPKGVGPRHMLFRDDIMYVACELQSKVCTVKRKGSGWEVVQILSTVPEDFTEFTAVAAIRCFGSSIFVSNRGHHSIAQFDIQPDGTLKLRRIFSSFGDFPRDFIMLDENTALVSNQHSGDVRLIDISGSEEKQISNTLSAPGVVCICPLD